MIYLHFFAEYTKQQNNNSRCHRLWRNEIGLSNFVEKSVTSMQKSLVRSLLRSDGVAIFFVFISIYFATFFRFDVIIRLTRITVQIGVGQFWWSHFNATFSLRSRKSLVSPNRLGFIPITTQNLDHAEHSLQSINNSFSIQSQNVLQINRRQTQARHTTHDTRHVEIFCHFQPLFPSCLIANSFQWWDNFQLKACASHVNLLYDEAIVCRFLFSNGAPKLIYTIVLHSND